MPRTARPRAVIPVSKSANAGELRTKVSFYEIRRVTDDEGFPVETPVNVFGDGNTAYVKWVNAHGSEALTALELQLREPATITMRYSPAINRRVIVFRGNDPDPYEIISIDNVEERDTWLELKVQRKEAAR